MALYQDFGRLTTMGMTDTLMGEVLSKAMTGFLLRAAGAVAQFGFTLLLARYYGAEGMGAYTLALSITVIASAVSRWGVDQAALKNIAVHADADDWEMTKTVFVSAFVVILTTGIVITILLYLLTPWITGTFFSNPKITGLMQVMVLSITPFALLNLAAESFRAIKKVVANAIVQVVMIPLLMLGGLFFLSQIGSLQVINVAYVYLLACIAVSIAALVYCYRLFGGEKGAIVLSQDMMKDLLQMAHPMAWATIIGIAMSFSEILLLGVFRSVDEVGIYSAALRVALLVNFVLVAFNTILAPKFAAFFHSDKRDEIEQLASRSVVVMLALTAPLFALCFLYPEQVLILFGADFVEASIALMILALSQLINVMTGPVGILLLMTGHEKILSRNSVVSAGVGITSGVLLIPLFGVTGAAAAAFVGSVTLQGLCVFSVKKHLSIGFMCGFRF